MTDRSRFGACILFTVLQKTQQDYECKQKEGKHGKEIFGLAWDVKELGDINDLGRQLIVECAALTDKLLDVNYDKIADNFASKLSFFRVSVNSMAKRVIKYRRIAATHVLIVMISPEERNSKPYALTIQCVAYKGIKDSEIRVLCNNVVKEMHAKKMKVAGEQFG